MNISLYSQRRQKPHVLCELVKRTDLISGQAFLECMVNGIIYATKFAQEVVVHECHSRQPRALLII